MFGIRRHPHRIVRRRNKALAGDLQVHDAVGRIVELAPGMAVRCTVGVGPELVVTEVHRRRQGCELRDVEVFALHAVWIDGQVVWMQV
ncbi:hypothetical protein D3C75_1297670 [compost metagenome]